MTNAALKPEDDATALPPKNHNQPPEELANAEAAQAAPVDPIDAATAPFADLIEEVTNWLDGSKIENEGQLAAVDDLLGQIRKAGTAIEKARKAATEPLHKAWKDEGERWKPTVADFERMKKGLVAISGAYRQELKRKRDEEAKRQREEAERKAAEAAAAAQAARQTGDLDAMREADQVADEAKKEQKQAKRAENKAGAVKGLRKVHKHEIENERDALFWIAANDRPALAAFVAEYVRRNCQSRQIDGVKTWIAEEPY